MLYFHIMRPYFILSLCLLLVAGCDFADFSDDSDERDNSSVELSFAVAPNIAWMPWYLANEEGVFKRYAMEKNIQFKFIQDNYQETIDRFIAGNIHAIAISNIDAIAQLVKREIKVDIILITNRSTGNHTILLPENANSSSYAIRGKTFALTKYSANHYLFDRYLIRHQIAFTDVSILDTPQTNIFDTFNSKKVYGVVTNNPYAYKIMHTIATKTLFNSRQIPKEIFDFIIVRRETLLKHPEFAQILLFSWFSIMERLQGNKRGPTLDALASLAQLPRQQYENQLENNILNDTSIKALASIRDRRIRKTMRHIRYFIQRHQLSNNDGFSNWISYPGRTPAIIHFNGEPLQTFVAPKHKTF
ncbi:MAG: ABC transporter substrate-binding protein [Thiomargarita sp.]|nr:ABC transporter substrate-binding protein [Thiomargarita sp.]